MKWARGIFMPRRCLSCDVEMSTAAADVKPCSTLSERKEAIAPAERMAVSENCAANCAAKNCEAARTEAERRHEQQEGADHH